MKALLPGILLLAGCGEEAEPPRAMVARDDGVLDLTLCTFNIRRADPPDEGMRAWSERVVRVVRALRSIDPGVFGVQEAQHVQAADLRASLTDYAFHGVGRDDGGRAGEYAGIFWKRERFEADPADRGTFWLSDTPDEAGSKSWGNSVVRAAGWVRLVDRASGRGFYVFNTHFDHRDQRSRELGARLIAGRIDARRRGDEPVVLLGDFNATHRNPAIEFLTGGRAMLDGERAGPWAGGLVDVFGTLRPESRDLGTLHFWRSDGGPPWRVDHILVGTGAELVDAGVHREGARELWPSDHHPVWVRVRWGGADGA